MFIKLVADAKYQLDNLSFCLFLETARWYSRKSTTQMWYWDDTLSFWKMGFRLLKDKFILFMGGLKNLGQVVTSDQKHPLVHCNSYNKKNQVER